MFEEIASQICESPALLCFHETVLPSVDDPAFLVEYPQWRVPDDGDCVFISRDFPVFPYKLEEQVPCDIRLFDAYQLGRYAGMSDDIVCEIFSPASGYGGAIAVSAYQARVCTDFDALELSGSVGLFKGSYE